LHRLTVNQVLMHFRRRVVKTEKVTDDGAIPIRIVSGTENPSRMAQIDRIALNEAVGQLPPGYRMVFILHDLEGYEHDQIGKMLGCAVGTSKSQLHKARQRLRQILTRRQNHPSKTEQDAGATKACPPRLRSGSSLNNADPTIHRLQGIYGTCG